MTSHSEKLVHLIEGCAYSSTLEFIVGPEATGMDDTDLTCPKCRIEAAKRFCNLAASYVDKAKKLTPKKEINN